MTEKQQETYMKTKERLRRMGIENPAEVIVALTEEIDHYRAKIRAMEEFIANRDRKQGNEMTLVEKLRNKQSRDNRELLDRAADRIEELEADCRKQSEVESLQAENEHLTAEVAGLKRFIRDLMKDEVKP